MDPPGFKRRDVDGQRVVYVSIPQVPGEVPFELHSMARLKKFLEKNPSRSVNLEDFDFCKRRSTTPAGGSKEKRWSDVFSDPVNVDEVGEEGTQEEPTGNPRGSSFNLENLMKAGAKLNHKTILKDAASRGLYYLFEG